MLTRRRIAAAIVVLVLGGVVGALIIARSRPAAVAQSEFRVPVGPDAQGRPVDLDATLFAGNGPRPAPAVILAHGFGGSKESSAADARALARRGYTVLAYSARGFGRSGGEIGVNSPDFEVRDAQRLIDLLATRPEVLLDGPGNPRVGVAGASYGGALALLLAGHDRRVDALVPAITWHDLRAAFFPQAAVGAAPGSGPFKRLWAGLFFGTGLGTGVGTGAAAGAGTGAGTSSGGTCGRFAATVCAAYQATAATGESSPAIRALLRRSSPATVLDRITAPTLLLQGQDDSLFPLDQAIANARGIAAAGTPVKVVWHAGGHDGGAPEAARLRRLTLDWFDRYLMRDGSPPDTRFTFTRSDAALSASDATPQQEVRVAAGTPPEGTAAVTNVALAGPPQTILAPAGGTPAAVSTLPGLGALLGSAGAAVGGGALPAQTAAFQSAPLRREVRLVGTPEVTLRVSGSATDATLFASLYDVPPDGGAATLPHRLVAPLRLTGLRPGEARIVRLTLPTVVRDLAAGHRVRLQITTSDTGYAMPARARSYRVALAGNGMVALPEVPARSVGGRGSAPYLLGAAAVALLAAIGSWLGSRRRRGTASVDEAQAAEPLAVAGLGKSYRGGVPAVSELSFTVGPGQVLGLLGPNGAGKTTTLRMVLGLLAPSTGTIRIFGAAVVAGSPVLSRVGAFIEGPGLLPHLSGLDNLRLYWRATGRPPNDACVDLVLEIAGLGADVERRVRTYSHGMKQRLAIAQAMLGLPDLLVLDEPTNGLDPPQIREMRAVLGRYAATGRTVVVSSHLLSEVEQTCTHAVVMNRGRLVAAGPVADLIGGANSLALDVDPSARAAEVSRALPGVTDVAVTARGIVVSLNGIPPSELVRQLVTAGVAVNRMGPQRQLEEVFLDLVGEG